MTKYIVKATRGDNVLDLLLTSASDNDTLSQVAVRSTCFSDHNLVTYRLHVPLHSPTISCHCYRDIRREAPKVLLSAPKLGFFDAGLGWV